MSPAATQARRGGQQAGGGSAAQSKTYRGWKNMNASDSRLSIDDDEVYLLLNMMYVGRGLQSVALYNGAAGNALHAGSLVKESFFGELTYGANTIPHPVAIVVFEDGSAYMRDMYLDGAVDTLVAAAGTFSSSAAGGTGITIWQDGPVLIFDDVAGYYQWTGLLLTAIDVTKKGSKLAVFESHVWLLTAARTTTYTAPNSFSDFTALNGAGTFKITDDVFAGAVQHLQSTVEQLWIVGKSAIDALGNVATSGGVTTFAVTNAIASLGTTYGDSVTGYFRALTFYTGYSVHSLLGVTPQKLSAKIDRLFPAFTGAITFGPRPGVVELNGQDVLAYLVSFTDPVTAVVSTRLLCFQEGKFFLAGTPDLAGNRVLDMGSLTTRTVPELWGIDAGGFIYRIFARSGDAKQGTWTVISKLHDFDEPASGHQGVFIGFDFSAPTTTAVSPIAVTLDTESASTQLGAINEKFLAQTSDPLGLRYAMMRRNAEIIGQRLGWTLSGNCADLVCLEAAHMKQSPTNDYEAVDGAPSFFVFVPPGGGEFEFLT